MIVDGPANRAEIEDVNIETKQLLCRGIHENVAGDIQAG